MARVASTGAVFFDLFGTLLSLESLDDACDAVAPGRGAEIATRWRARQLEISWLRTIMDRWADFDVLTRDALDMTLRELGVDAPDLAGLERLAATYAKLPLRDGAADAVRRLRDAGRVTGVLSNGSQPTLDTAAARLGLPFDHVLSVDAVRRFKPAPEVYQLTVDATSLPAEAIGFVSANGWDAAGAAAFGLRVAWLRVSPATVLPPVGTDLPRIVASWDEVPAAFAS
jgi:2-haloacid dehalogenase